jgi:hypothetical protein
MRLPGCWLRAVAARLCAKRTMERVIDPIVADVHAEYAAAVQTRSWRRAIWICVSGYFAFWKAAGLYALTSGVRSVWNNVGSASSTLARLAVFSTIGVVSVAALLSAPAMLDSASRFGPTLTLLLAPQAIAISIPIAVPLAIAFGEYGTRVTARTIRGVLLLAIVGTLGAFATMLMLPRASDAYRAGIGEKLSSRGVTYSSPRGVGELSLSELADLREDYDAGGFSEKAGTVARAYHMRLALPVATFVLSLLALGICESLRGRALRAAAVIVALALYWAVLAAAEWIPIVPAVVSVWAPNIVFAAVSFNLLKATRATERSA